MSKVILSFLGTGNYTPTQYWLDGKPYPDLSTPYIQEALLKRYEEEGWVLKVLMTKEAEERHKEALAERVKYEAVRIPAGHTEGELWQIFNAIVDSIPEGAELIMDISHGFRSQPILALAAVQFLQVVKGVRVRRILYGFYEPTKPKGNFFDLTGFLDLMEWTQATHDLLEHGEGLRLRKLLREIHSHSYQVEGPKAKKLTSVGEALDNVEDALDLLRSGRGAVLSSKAFKAPGSRLRGRSPTAPLYAPGSPAREDTRKVPVPSRKGPLQPRRHKGSRGDAPPSPSDQAICPSHHLGTGAPRNPRLRAAKLGPPRGTWGS